jgi:hypothetical protein
MESSSFLNTDAAYDMPEEFKDYSKHHNDLSKLKRQKSLQVKQTRVIFENEDEI